MAEMTHSLSVCKLVKICKETPIEPESVALQNLVGSYAVVKDSSKKWVAYIEHQDEEFGDYFVKFLLPHGVCASYTFSENAGESCFKNAEQIVGVLPNSFSRDTLVCFNLMCQ